jgi:NAD(P)H-hydrate epimerase
MSLPVISIAQMREWEKATWDAGQSEAEVIRRVGQALARHALQLTKPRGRILILAGKGHNGDDARAAREHLSDRKGEVLEVRDPETDVAKLEALLSPRPALVVDGLFGIGLDRALAGAWVAFIQRLNAARPPILAVDVPSGLNADTGEAQGAAVEASVTLTVGAPKKGLLATTAYPHVGRLDVADDVGLAPCPFTSDLNWTLPGDFADFPPARAVGSHKGTYGHLAIIAGSVGYHGAAVLAARGAQRARPGLISLFTHELTYHAVAGQLQAVMVHPWTPDLDVPGKFTAILVGPGLAAADLPEEMRFMTRRWWNDARIPMIVDASALDWLGQESRSREMLRVITPHPGEATRLLKTTTGHVQANRPQAVRELSRNFGNGWVVLKGHQTLVGRGTEPIFVNPSGNPELAQGGAGDLLSGYLAGLLAQPVLQGDASRTLRYAAWQHGAAADLLDALRRNWTVEDLADALGRVQP